jgi:hypothetical protein
MATLAHIYTVRVLDGALVAMVAVGPLTIAYLAVRLVRTFRKPH